MSLRALPAGSLLTAAVLMLWGFLAWAVLAGEIGVVRTVPQEEAVLDFLRETVTEDGTYFFPVVGFEGGPDERAAWADRHARGPLGFLHFRAAGVRPSPLQMLWGLLHFWAAAALAGGALRLAAPPTYGARVRFVALLGAFAAIAIHPGPSIWWYTPWRYSLFALAVEVVAWLLAGLVLARFVRPD